MLEIEGIKVNAAIKELVAKSCSRPDTINSDDIPSR